MIFENQGPQITLDFFSGIGGWQSGNDQGPVISIEKDPEVARIQAAQQGSRIIGESQIEEIWHINTEDLPIILNFDVRDKRWWILFNLFRVLYAVASPPCVSWSGATFAAGLDQEEGILFGETLIIAFRLHICKFALENVCAILGHKHWKILSKLIEEVMQKHLTILRLDLSMFSPLRRLRAFFFVDNSQEVIEIVPRKTWLHTHIIQSVAWTPLFRASANDLALTETARHAASEPALLPLEWKNGAIESMITRSDCLRMRTVSPFDAVVSSCMSQYGFQHHLNLRLLRGKGLLSFFFQDDRAIGGLRLVDPLEFAWLLGFGDVRWPRCLKTAYKVLGNCVAPFHAKIANFWMKINWLNHSADPHSIWDELNVYNGARMLAHCQFAQDEHWIQWISSTGA